MFYHKPGWDKICSHNVQEHFLMQLLEMEFTENHPASQRTKTAWFSLRGWMPRVGLAHPLL